VRYVIDTENANKLALNVIDTENANKLALKKILRVALTKIFRATRTQGHAFFVLLAGAAGTTSAA